MNVLSLVIKMANLQVLLLATLALARLGTAYKVLVVFPFPAKSHSILGEGFVRNLAGAGHEVTYITPILMADPPPNVQQVDVSSNLKLNLTSKINIKSIMEKKIDLTDRKAFFPLLVNLSRNTIEDENVQKLVNDPSVKFDVVINEWMFNEMNVGLAAIFNCPFIWFSSTEPHSQVLDLIDETLNPSYNADPFVEGTPPYSFYERVEKLFYFLVTTFMKEYYSTPLETEEYEKLYKPLVEKKGIKLPSFEEIKYNASLVLGNSHVSLGQATRLPQNYKPIAGYHINPNVKPLPEDLKKIMDTAEHGVIYFSMGSNLKSKDLPEEIKKDFVEIFRGLKQTVIWKFEESFPQLPKNIHIVQWAPQPSILSHPNCKVFITHGGLLSTTEAVHFGVPIIGIPVFADQFINVARAERKGFAKGVQLSYTMAKDLKVAIEEIVGNPKYGERAKELSMIYHDRPVSPGAELVHWVEHVVRTSGAPHLRSPALGVPLYQKIYLDLLVTLIAVLAATGYIIKIILVYLKNKIWKANKKQNKQKRN